MKRLSLSVFALLFSMQALHAQGSVQPAASQVIDVWPEGKMPGRAATAPEGPGPDRGDGFQRITNISRPTLTVFQAPKSAAPAPAVIVSPGGGYSYVVFDKEGVEVAKWLNSLGITALVLKYRTPNNRDGALQDIQRALSLVRSQAASLNIDPKRVGVIGFSAGGHLSAKASLLFDERTYPAIDAVDQQGCRPDFAMLVYPAYLEKNDALAPDIVVKPNTPPTLIVHTEDDRSFVKGSKLYHAALDEHKVPNQFNLYPTGGHGYGLRSDKDVRVWPEVAAQWLRSISVIR